jgi:hypothetical protein
VKHTGQAHTQFPEHKLRRRKFSCVKGLAVVPDAVRFAASKSGGQPNRYIRSAMWLRTKVKT